MRVKKGDTVLVIKGKDRGKTGKIIQVLPNDNKVVIEGVNVHKKAVKPDTKNVAGGIIEVNAGLEASNVAIMCPRCNKPSRMGYEVVKGEKARVCKSCKERI